MNRRGFFGALAALASSLLYGGVKSDPHTVGYRPLTKVERSRHIAEILKMCPDYDKWVDAGEIDHAVYRAGYNGPAITISSQKYPTPENPAK